MQQQQKVQNEGQQNFRNNMLKAIAPDLVQPAAPKYMTHEDAEKMWSEREMNLRVERVQDKFMSELEVAKSQYPQVFKLKGIERALGARWASPEESWKKLVDLAKEYNDELKRAFADTQQQVVANKDAVRTAIKGSPKGGSAVQKTKPSRGRGFDGWLQHLQDKVSGK
jgi:hypothetical protein